MSHTTECLKRRCDTSHELRIRQRVRPACALHVAVRHEPLPSVEEDRLTRIAALQRLDVLRRKINAVKRLQEMAASHSIDLLC